MSEGSEPFEVVYVALGESYVREAAVSAWSVKRHMPSARISVLTDCDVGCDHFDAVIPIRSEGVITRARRARAAKAQALLTATSRNVIFLDTDTYVTSDISDVLEVLAKCDLAIAHDTWRYPEAYARSGFNKGAQEAPAWYPYFNAGVIFARRCLKVDQFLEDWSNAIFADEHISLDQPLFRALLHASDLLIHTLPSEYNARPGAVHMSGRVHVLHTRMSTNEWRWSLPFLADFVNSDFRNRCYTAHDGKLVIVTEDYEFLERDARNHHPVVEREEFLWPRLRLRLRKDDQTSSS